MFLEEAATRRCGSEVILGCNWGAAVGSTGIKKKPEYYVLIQEKVSNKCGTRAVSYTQETQASRPVIAATQGSCHAGP